MATPTPPDLDHLSLPVADLERSLRFYVEVLGMRVLWREGDMALVRAGAHADLALNQAAQATPAPALHFGFKVASQHDIDRWAAYLESCKVAGLVREGPQLYFRDPDGYTLEIYFPGQ